MKTSSQLQLMHFWKNKGFILLAAGLLCMAIPFYTATAQTAGDGPQAFVEVGKFGNIDNTTYTTPSFQVINTSSEGVQIDSVTFDIRSALFQDLVFDPYGEAGDQVGRCVVPDTAKAEKAGYIWPDDECSDPFSNPYEEGYQTVTLGFNEFDPGDTLQFGVNIDPTSVKGYEGTISKKSGSHVSGLELSGSVVTVVFSDGSTLTSTLYNLFYRKLNGQERKGDSYAIVAAAPPEAPSIEMLGVTSPDSVAEAEQTVQVSGSPGDTVRLLQVDGRMYIEEGTPDNGYDIDPYEANSAVDIKEYQATIGEDGHVDIPVTLMKTAVSEDEGPDGGLNHFIAVAMDQSLTNEKGATRLSGTSNVVVVGFDGTTDDKEPTAVEAQEMPKSFELKGNYPNPFNPSTAISFDLPTSADVTVQVVDMTGRLVMELHRQQMAPGSRLVEVDASGLASGTYFYRVTASMPAKTIAQTGQMVLVK